MRTFLQDLRYGIRLLLKTPRATAVAVASLALGMGLNSAVFSVVDGMFLRPPSIRQPEQLVWIYGRTPQGSSTSTSYLEYLDLRDQSNVFSGLVAQSRRGSLLRVDDEIEVVMTTVVSANHFSVLGAGTALGRAFSPELDSSPEKEPVVILSHGLWQRRFGSDPQIIGKSIPLFERNCTVVGVLPQSFRGLEGMIAPDIWLPATSWVAITPGNRPELERRDSRIYEVLGRLRPGVTVEQAQAQLDTIARRLEQAYPATNKGRRLSAVPETRRAAGRVRMSLLLMSIVGLVLLIACANVATLLLAQGESRRREIGVRLALGAGRRRVLRQLLTESLLLSLVGAALGLLLASWLMDLAPALMPAGPFRLRLDVRLDQRVGTFTLIASLVTALLFGLAPALRASKADVAPVLKGEEPGRRSRRFSLWNVLAVGQIALSIVLLSASGLLLRSFLYTQQIDPGFDTKKNMLVIMMASGSLSGPRQAQALFQRLAERLGSLPGVAHATYARRLLLAGSGGGATKEVSIPGVELPPGRDTVEIKFNQVADNYFATMGTRVARGRGIERRDGPDSLKVVLINETMARQFWPNQDPIGRWLRIGRFEHQIVGIVEDGKINQIHEAPEPFLYFAFAQMPPGEATLLVETAGDPALLADAVKREMRSVDPKIVILSLMTMKQHMANALYMDRIPAVVSSGLAVLGMLLAAIGLYGVMSYAVNRRTHEFGVRLAMGAQERDVLGLVMRQGLKLALVGVPIGLAAALAATRVMSSFVYGVSPGDPLTFAASAVLVVAVGLLATEGPARRATKVDPVVALRHE